MRFRPEQLNMDEAQDVIDHCVYREKLDLIKLILRNAQSIATQA